MKKIFVTMAKKQCNTMIFTTNKLTINHRGGIENVLLYRKLFGHIYHKPRPQSTFSLSSDSEKMRWGRG